MHSQQNIKKTEIFFWNLAVISQRKVTHFGADAYNQ
jgi:hypothetical protein